MKFKPKRYLIVDGYNIINAWDELKKIANVDFEGARENLVSKVLEYSQLKGFEPYVVFDAYKVKGLSEKIEERKHITVIYTKQNQTADSYIEKFISGLSKYDEVSVATSDFAEQQIVLGKGGRRISAREFINDLKMEKKKIKNRSNKNKKVHRNKIEDALDQDTYEKLEKIRRG